MEKERGKKKRKELKRDVDKREMGEERDRK